MGLLCVKMNAYLFFTLLFYEIGLYFMTLYCHQDKTSFANGLWYVVSLLYFYYLIVWRVLQKIDYTLISK